jgi:amidase
MNAKAASLAFLPYPDAAVPHAIQGPLAGLSFAVKDLFDVAGYPTGCGQPFKLAQSGIKSQHAAAVKACLNAGAAFAGKVVTDELAFSLNGQNAHFGSPINAKAPLRITGGSSSGSASAVAHGACDFALGTDTGGSVRAPASHCGLWGMRPTHGRVSLSGCMDLAPSLDTCGWFANDAANLRRVGEVLLGADAKSFLNTASRVMLATDIWAMAMPEALPGLRAARDRVLKALDASAAEVAVFSAWSSDDIYWGFRHTQALEAWASHGEFISTYKPPLGPGVAQRMAWSATITQAQYDSAAVLRKAYRASLAQLLGDDGLLLIPTMPDIAPLSATPEDQLEDYRNRALRMLCTAGWCGLPQINLPLAGHSGAPLGVSLIGPAGSDVALLRIAERVASV